jgi:hypothetical protein
MRLDLGCITRHVDGRDVEPNDEALIFIDDDNGKTIHIQCPDAKQIANKIIKAFMRASNSAPGLDDRDLLVGMMNDATGSGM